MTVLEKFLEEGRENRSIEIARNLKVLGDDLDKIVKVTGLTRKEIEDLTV